MPNITGNGVADTKQKLKMNVLENGFTTVPIDILDSQEKEFQEVQFQISTGLLATEMTAETLRSFGYDIKEEKSITIPKIRVGFYDFNKTQVNISTQNILGVNIIKHCELGLYYANNSFEVDLINRFKPLVEKGINKVISSVADSVIKGSKYNASNDWYTWSEIDKKYPNSWILLWGGDDEFDYGGEVLWYSETDIPETIQDNTFLYCNKSIATGTPFAFAYEDSIRCRNFTTPDKKYLEEITRLESLLINPTINRFYYDVISRQGKFFTNKNFENRNQPTKIILTQEQIDELISDFLKNQ